MSTVTVCLNPLPKSSVSQVDFGTELSGLNIEDLSGKCVWKLLLIAKTNSKTQR